MKAFYLEKNKDIIDITSLMLHCLDGIKIILFVCLLNIVFPPTTIPDIICVYYVLSVAV